MNESITVKKHKRNLWLVLLAGLFLGILATAGILAGVGWLQPPMSTTNRQTMVHDMGSQVMPFSLGQTTHIFEMTETGGVQQVVAKDPHDSSQIALIQQHLQHEAMLFSEGDFTDPSSLHGTSMPGLDEMSRDASRIKIAYAVLPNGAQITFTTQDVALITAIHRWFGAQLSDHGADAVSR